MSGTPYPLASKKAPGRGSVLVTSLLVALLCLPASAQRKESPPPEVAFTPFHSSGIYQPGEKPGWTVTRVAGATGPARFNYIIRKNGLEVLRRGTLDLSSGKAAIEEVVNEPCMIYVQLTPEGTPEPPLNPQRPPYASAGAAVSPELIQPSAPRPADFDDFWAAKLKAQSAIPMNPVLRPVASNVPGVEMNAVKVDSLGSQMHGYIVRPQREGKFPALVTYQGAGVYALRPAAAQTHAAEGWLVLDVDAHDKEPDVAK
jgi:cephalosporin-C deacetylase